MWAKFQHKDAIFTDFEDIMKEIQDETDRGTDNRKCISDKEIILRIHSPDLPTLTLVDLPGFTKIPLPDQPEDLPEQIEQLVEGYIASPNSIIVAVTAANTDPATSESLQAAKRVDPNNDRTVAVVTKLDIMNHGTDAGDLLRGKVVPMKLGIVGVVNCSQQEIKQRVSLADKKLMEASFFRTNYPDLAERNGIPFLVGHLSKLLLNHIQKCFPKLRGQVLDQIIECEDQVTKLGQELPQDSQLLTKVLADIINKFVDMYKTCIQEPETHFTRNSITGGAYIFHIFNVEFNKLLREIDSLDGITVDDIRESLKKSQLPSQSMFPCEKAFHMLVKQQIQLVGKPSLRCIQLVYAEMEDLIHKCLKELTADVVRFPNIPTMIIEIMKKLLKNCYDEATRAVKDMISSQRSYINVWHPDFLRAVAEKANVPNEHMNENMPKVKELNGLLFAATAHVEPDTCRLTQILIQSYMSIVVRDVEDLVPKMIIHFLVDGTVKHLYSELTSNMHSDDLANKALRESQDLLVEREKRKEALCTLHEANKILEELCNYQ